MHFFGYLSENNLDSILKSSCVPIESLMHYINALITNKSSIKNKTFENPNHRVNLKIFFFNLKLK